ncbi:MAG: hypothetical protein KJ626_16165, partial [Verrucomicrobia bacterium]|nr:hypothetical protein [Verrucomicrobiota bacterium]
MFCLVVALVLSFSFMPASHAASVELRVFDNLANTSFIEYSKTGSDKTHRVRMEQVAFGAWRVLLDLPSGSYKYRFLLDGDIPVSDLSNPDFKREDSGDVFSLLAVNEEEQPYADVDGNGPPPHSISKHSVVVQYENQNAKSVLLAGEFNSWAMDPMRRLGNGVWRTTLQLPEGSYGYKFIVDGEWIFDPNSDERKKVNGVENSLLTVSSDVVAVSPGPEGSPATEDALPVTFRFYAPQVDSMAVVGTFNDWNGSRNPMIRSGDIWECTVSLSEGTYEYKFKSGESWWIDPNNPQNAEGSATGNALLNVRPAKNSATGNTRLIDPDEWIDAGDILLEPATGLHCFQQELIRSYVYVVARDRYGLHIADGTLLQPDSVPIKCDSVWGWSVVMDQAQPLTAMTVYSNTVRMAFRHPLLGEPAEWLREVRGDVAQLIDLDHLENRGPTSPPLGSAWAKAQDIRDSRQPFADVYAINTMTLYGQTNGWSQELMQDIARTYADMSDDYRFYSVGGWAPSVFAARAVVYADLARGEANEDETMAYVLYRIGRPKDAADFLPDSPQTFHGRLTQAAIERKTDELMRLTGSADNYGLTLARGQTSHAPTMKDLSRIQKAYTLRTLARMLSDDQRENLARVYLMASVNLLPQDFAGHLRALEMGSVGAGHRHASQLLELVAETPLWESALRGDPPEFTPQANRQGPTCGITSRTEQQLARSIGEISVLYQEKKRKVLDTTNAAVPEAVRLDLLRDFLNVAWWRNAFFYGLQLSSAQGSQSLNRIMASWKPLQPEMEGFTRFLMRRTMNDYTYS